MTLRRLRRAVKFHYLVLIPPLLLLLSMKHYGVSENGSEGEMLAGRHGVTDQTDISRQDIVNGVVETENYGQKNVNFTETGDNQENVIQFGNDDSDDQNDDTAKLEQQNMELESNQGPSNSTTSRDRTMLQTIRETEQKYRDKLVNLTPDEVKALSKSYYRDVRLHWASPHGLLPRSKPVADPACQRHSTGGDAGIIRDDAVSVVMCYNNELIYLMLRTLTTLRFRTPMELLSEVLLIDDNSKEETKRELLEFSSALGLPIRHIRSNTSLGITGCRRRGVEEAQGNVVVILDSHVEVADTWLEPLLEILHAKPRAIAVPTLDLIKEWDYEELHTRVCKAYGIGMYYGHAQFAYYAAGPPTEDQSEPYQTSSIMGGALAAYKTTLLDMYPKPVYDELWGTENARLALRAWCCGDGLWMTRCSQVLHANGPDGDLTRYKGPGHERMWDHLHHESVAEAANLITDEAEREKFIQSAFFRDEDVESVHRVRDAISKDFQVTRESCHHDYAWYLTQIQKSSHYFMLTSREKFTAVGEIHSVSRPEYCIASKNQAIVTSLFCRTEKVIVGHDSLFAFSASGEIYLGLQFNFPCLDTKHNNTIGSELGISHSCGQEPNLSNTNFEYREGSGQIVHVPSGRCLVMKFVAQRQEGRVMLETCSEGVSEQQWTVHKPRWV